MQSWNESMLFCLPQGEYQGVMMSMRRWYMSRVKHSPPTNVASILMTLKSVFISHNHDIHSQNVCTGKNNTKFLFVGYQGYIKTS